ncbi:MAG: hypothetical protein DRI72_09880 [Bacteroidetes bacterium]|nr:MAG: hypothetical protein DRI72_09880 [Bacteroidota bacterium]
MQQPDKPYRPTRPKDTSVPDRRMKRSDNLIFLLCLIIAAFFWLLIKLSGTYTVSYNFKIKYTNVPAEKRLTKIIDTTLNISFTARGYDILKLNITESMDEMTIDLKDYEIKKSKDDTYFIHTGLIREELASYININESDVLLSKNALHFVLSGLHVKDIKVKTREDILFKDPYGLYEQERVEPAKVSVYGPSSVLDTMHYVYTEVISLTSVDKDQIIKARLYNPLPELINIEPDEVLVKLRVERFTESFVETEIDVSDIPKKIRTFPSTVRINFKVAQKDFSNIKAGQFRVVPETDNINLNEVKRLHLRLAEKPDFIRDEWIVPADVEFLIIKK